MRAYLHRCVGRWFDSRKEVEGGRARFALRIPVLRVATAFTVLLAVLLGITPTAQAATTTIDFSAAGVGPFDQSFFKKQGVVFTDGTFVGFVQSDEALIGPIAGKVRGGFTTLSLSVAPAFQGTATYTLIAFRKGKEIARTSVTVTQDLGDPSTSPAGYFTISIGPLPKKADSFSLSNKFVRSSFPNNTLIEFGVSSITFSRH